MVKKIQPPSDEVDDKPTEPVDCLASLPADIVRFRVLSPQQTARLLGLSEATLERMRKLKSGP
ncbi:MAG: hypothetical protein AB7O95_03305 [Geminicoccaceae bacterium]